MVAAGTRERRSAFEERFRAEVSWRDGTSDEVPPWFSSLITDLVVATGDDAIRYFSASYVPATDLHEGSMAVIVFTDDLVAYANLDLGGASQFEVMVTARRSLSSFSIDSEGSTGGDDLSTVRISVIYPQFSRTLPLGASDWSSREDETAELIRQLRFDLVR